MVSRMKVGKYPTRAAALDFLVEKYSTKEVRARYVLKDADIACVVFTFERDFGGGKKGEVGYTGNGADLSEAIRDLYDHLGEAVDDKPGAKEA